MELESEFSSVINLNWVVKRVHVQYCGDKAARIDLGKQRTQNILPFFGNKATKPTIVMSFDRGVVSRWVQNLRRIISNELECKRMKHLDEQLKLQQCRRTVMQSNAINKCSEIVCFLSCLPSKLFRTKR